VCWLHLPDNHSVPVKASMGLLLGVGAGPVLKEPLGGAVTTHDVIQHLLLTSLGVVAEADPHAVLVAGVDSL